jgi:hypothetical protein
MCVGIGTRLAGDLAPSIGAAGECGAANTAQGCETEEYEKAAGLRDQIRALSVQLETQSAVKEG